MGAKQSGDFKEGNHYLSRAKYEEAI